MTSINLRGIPFLLHENESLSNAIAKNGDFWEADILDYLRNNFPYQRTIIDIGANIGNHTVYFANFLTAERIISIEADKINYDLLCINTFNYDNVYCYNIALSDYVGEAWIQHNLTNWGAHEVHDSGDEKVRCTSLDEYMFLDSLTLMKIDVEWLEPSVLKGAEQTIQYNRPLILIEDIKNEYGALLPDYTLIKRWDHHGTSLYIWGT